MVPFIYNDETAASNSLLSQVTDTGNPDWPSPSFDGASDEDVYITSAFTPNSAGVIHYRAVAWRPSNEVPISLGTSFSGTLVA